jgi:hypothetical protein
MRRIFTALGAGTALFGAMLTPSAGASVAPGHGPGAAGHGPGVTSHGPGVAASQVRHDNTNSPIRVTSLGAGFSAVKVVSLGASFSPSSTVLAPGEPLIIIVSRSVRAHLEIASGGSLVYDGHDGDVYLFFARKPGMSVVSAQVRPRCETKMCPQWRTAPDLTVTTY